MTITVLYGLVSKARLESGAYIGNVSLSRIGGFIDY